MGYELEKQPWPPVYDAPFFLVRNKRMARNCSSPEANGRRIQFENSNKPFAGVIIPKQRCHSLSEAPPSKSANDKELTHVVGARVAQPVSRRSDKGKASDRITRLRKICAVPVFPYGGCVVRVASVGFGFYLKPFSHVLNVVLEQAPKQRVRFRAYFRNQKFRRRHLRMVTRPQMARLEVLNFRSGVSGFFHR